MTRSALFLVGMSFWCACAHQFVMRDGVSRENIFPNGLYKHTVTLSLAQKFAFNGIVQIRPDVIKILGLSHFSTTVFRIEEDRASGAVSVEVFMEEFKKNEPKIREYYAVLRLLLLAKFPPEGPPIEQEFVHDDKKVRVTFAEYEEHGIPRVMSLRYDAFFAEIRVTGYEI